MFDDDRLPELISARLNRPQQPVHAEPFPDDYFSRPARPAAVLLPLIRKPDGWHLILIRRALDARDRHSGEVALPGGCLEACDRGEEAAALREAAEEIGLERSNVFLLGRLGGYRSVSNFRITPVVGQVLEDFEPRPNPREVARVFSMPLHWLAAPDNLQRRRRRLGATGVEIEVLHYRPYDGEQLWGVTARLVDGFMNAMLDRD